MTAHHKADALAEATGARPRYRFAELPTPLTLLRVGEARVWIKRDDLTGPGMGGNKLRKLEYLVGDALRQGADCLLTVGAAQSNHARLTAAVGAITGLPTHLVLGGGPTERLQGNQLLSGLFGAQPHFPGTDDWDELEAAQEELASALRAEDHHPYVMPIGGSTAIGAVGFAAAYGELMEQCAARGIDPAAIVHATSSGGTHAGLLAGTACRLADGERAPELLAISVAKTATDLHEHGAALARDTLRALGLGDVVVPDSSVEVDGRWKGTAYADPTPEADRAVVQAARTGAIVLDRVYTGKAFAGLLGNLAEGRWGPSPDVVFWHTGGQPAVFAPDGCPSAGVSDLGAASSMPAPADDSRPTRTR